MRCWAILALVLLDSSGCARRAGPIAARVTSAQGSVSVQVEDRPSRAAPGATLYEGDVVTTGAQSSAAIGFEGGGTVSLGPDTALLIRRTGGAAAQLGAVLLQGDIRAAAKRGGVRFTIGTPFGIAEMGGADAEVGINAADGLKVLIGVVEVVDAGGKRNRLEAGASMDRGGVVNTAAARETIDLAPLEFVLLGNPKQVQVKRAGEETWNPVNRRDVIKAGDSIRTRRATGTRVRVGEHAGVALEPDSELKVLESARQAKTDRARYELASGGAVFAIDRAGGSTTIHEVQMGPQKVTIEPGVAAADIELHASASGRGQVAVRQGRATLANGSVVEPGSLLSIDKDGTTSLHPLAATRIEVSAGSAAVVYYRSEVPALKLDWEHVAGGPPFEVEVASDRDFHQVVWHEVMQQPGMIFDRLKPGRYYWRVHTGTASRNAIITIEPGRDTDCRGCKHANVIDDTGENTTVYFQKKLPAITLRWTVVPEAGKYHVKLFSKDAIDRPIIDETTAQTTLPLGERLPENDYFWVVQPLAAQGKEIAAGRVNGLSIAYDNAVVDLEVRTPAHKAVINAASVNTSGEVRLGSRLAINGRAVTLDKKGRFWESVALVSGDNQLVYRTLGSDGVERFYIREVRRP